MSSTCQVRKISTRGSSTLFCNCLLKTAFLYVSYCTQPASFLNESACAVLQSPCHLLEKPCECRLSNFCKPMHLPPFISRFQILVVQTHQGTHSPTNAPSTGLIALLHHTWVRFASFSSSRSWTLWYRKTFSVATNASRCHFFVSSALHQRVLDWDWHVWWWIHVLQDLFHTT